MLMKKSFAMLPILALLPLVALAFACSRTAEAQTGPDEAAGVSFKMTMSAPGRDAVEFTGMALGDDCKLTGVVGGIQSVTLLTGGKLYSLTPAIKTASEIDNPPPPGRDEGGWPAWLAEFGRVNPLAFAGLVGLEEDVDGQVRIGENNRIELRFEGGRLISLSFPAEGREGSITYTYSDYQSDADIAADDFALPDDYVLSD
jgi:hypothetical protein